MLRSGTCGADRGSGSLVQQCWLFGALLRSLSHLLLAQLRSKALHQSIKGEKDDLAGLVVFSVRDFCVAVVCGLSGSVVGNSLGCGLYDCKSHVAVGLAAQRTGQLQPCYCCCSHAIFAACFPLYVCICVCVSAFARAHGL